LVLPMPCSEAIRVCDVRAVFGLVGECRELGDDASRWWSHFLAGLAKLAGASFGLGAEIGGWLSGPRRRGLGTTTWGWENGFDPRVWLVMLETFGHDPLYNPLMNAYIARMPRELGVCFRRPELIPDDEWYGSPYFETMQRPLGVDAILSCFHP